jgi:hypothetical protein
MGYDQANGKYDISLQVTIPNEWKIWPQLILAIPLVLKLIGITRVDSSIDGYE